MRLTSRTWDFALHTDDHLLSELLVDAGQRYHSRPALIFPDARLTYSELSALSQRYARAMLGHGISRGDHVGILATNRIEYVPLLFACMMCGAVAVLLNARFRVQELRHAVNKCDLKWLFAGQSEGVPHIDRLREALPSIQDIGESGIAVVPGTPRLERVIALDAVDGIGLTALTKFLQEDKQADQGQLEQRRREIIAAEPALIIFTSGTTSLPKGCELSQESVFKTSLAMRNRLSLRSDERIWDPLPMFHMAAILPMLSLFHDGGAYVTDEKFDADRAIQQITQEAATFLYPAFPAIMSEIVKHPDFDLTAMRHVRLINNVAAAEALQNNMRIWPTATHISAYGMTELSGIASHTDPDDTPGQRAETCGNPYDDVEVMIVDQETGKPCDQGQKGEICVRGFLLFLGYYGQPEETAKVMDDHGWFHTGDMGSLDPEGRILFHGRIKDMLKVGGENVSPLEIEGWLEQHPAVLVAQVVGAPDSRLDEVVAAFIQLKPGVNVEARELIDFCGGQIASFKVPRVVRFVTEWPMSATKIQKSVLRETLVAELPAT